MQNLILIILIWKKEKSKSTNILAIEVREHPNNNYQNHVNTSTDGSVPDSLDSGAGFVIPDLKVQRCFYLGKGSPYSHLSYAVLMAFNYISNIQLAVFYFLSVLIQNQFYMHCKTGTAKWNGYTLQSEVFNTLYHV